jgi:hypothetical protein
MIEIKCVDCWKTIGWTCHDHGLTYVCTGCQKENQYKRIQSGCNEEGSDGRPAE